MNNEKTIYCIDTSVFLQLHFINKIIPIPDVWDEFDVFFNENKIISHEFVFEEFYSKTSKNDFIKTWISNKKSHFYKITERQIELVPQILEKFPKLIDPNKENNQADPWLIALAIEIIEEPNLFENKNVVLVSQEKLSSNIKIPAACKAFGVPHINLETFFEENGWKLGLKK